MKFTYLLPNLAVAIYPVIALQATTTVGARIRSGDADPILMPIPALLRRPGRCMRLWHKFRPLLMAGSFSLHGSFTLILMPPLSLASPQAFTPQPAPKPSTIHQVRPGAVPAVGNATSSPRPALLLAPAAALVGMQVRVSS